MMISDNQLRIAAGLLGIASVVLLPFYWSGVTTLSIYLAFPMHLGVILMGTYLTRSFRKRTSPWDGSVPIWLFLALTAMFLLGWISIAYGFSEFMPLRSPSGEPVSQFSANFEGGICYVIYNRGQPIPMPASVCDEFARKMSVAFCGFWLVGSAVVNWAAWKRRTT